MNAPSQIAYMTTGISLIAVWWILFMDDDMSPPLAEVATNCCDDDMSEKPIAAPVVETSVLEDSFLKPTPKALARKSTLLRRRSKKPITITPATFYKHLQRHYEATQLTITNTSEQTRSIHLWSGNQKPVLSPLVPEEVTAHRFDTVSISSPTQAAYSPQGMLVNPFNGYVYIANQLSNTISIVDSSGTLVSLLPITPTSSISPVDLTVIPDTVAPNFGTVYVANSIGDTVTVIDRQLKITNTIAVGKRPIAIVYNPFNKALYVANIASNTISVIDSRTETLITTIAVAIAPRHLTVAPTTGNVYVLSLASEDIQVISPTHQLIGTIEAVGTDLRTAAYHPINDSLYVVSGSGNVIPVTLATGIPRPAIAVGANPYRIVYNPTNALLYVGNRADDTYTLIGAEDSIQATLSLGKVGTSIAIAPDSNQLYSNDTLNASITRIQYSRESDAILINDGYYRKREDFTFQPARIKHVKFVFSDNQHFNVLRLTTATVTGTNTVRSIAISNYNSPQNFSNVAEVNEMEGTILDGKHGWQFEVGGQQTITILTYYRQVAKERSLPYA